MDGYLALFDLVGTLARRRFQVAERHFATLGLNHTEARLLNILDQEGGRASQDTLSSAVIIDRSNVARALKHLEQTGYVTREQDDADKRAKLVKITRKGRASVAKIAVLRNDMAAHFFGDLTEQEAAKIVAQLRKALDVHA